MQVDLQILRCYFTSLLMACSINTSTDSLFHYKTIKIPINANFISFKEIRVVKRINFIMKKIKITYLCAASSIFKELDCLLPTNKKNVNKPYIHTKNLLFLKHKEFIIEIHVKNLEEIVRYLSENIYLQMVCFTVLWIINTGTLQECYNTVNLV